MPTIAFTDVQYGPTDAQAACVVVGDWAQARPSSTRVVRVAAVAPYEAGAFFKRELPCLLAVLAEVGPVTCVVIDGYVYLDEQRTPGLGARLYEALGGAVPVVGIAKTAFRGSPMAAPLKRGGSAKPLYVTSVGVPLEQALEDVKRLHGPHRIPTLLGEVDRLARGRGELGWVPPT